MGNSSHRELFDQYLIPVTNVMKKLVRDKAYAEMLLESSLDELRDIEEDNEKSQLIVESIVLKYYIDKGQWLNGDSMNEILEQYFEEISKRIE